MQLMELLQRAINEHRYSDAIAIVDQGAPLNDLSDQGVTPIFWAVLEGHVPLVRAMLDAGADPNRRAEEPDDFMYAAPTPLDLAMQARFLVNWDKYQPIVELLLARGAKCLDGSGELENPGEVEEKARRSQSNQSH